MKTVDDTQTSLWSLRYSPAWGWRWIRERYCLRDQAEGWLAAYTKDDPATLFRLSDKKPKVEI